MTGKISVACKKKFSNNSYFRKTSFKKGEGQMQEYAWRCGCGWVPAQKAWLDEGFAGLKKKFFLRRVN
jgi:hypothetical protein